MIERRLRIAFDIDDVLARSAAGFAEFSNTRWGTAITAADYSEDWAAVWGVTVAEAMRRSEEFHSSDAVLHYEAFDGALPVLQRLKSKADLCNITSRQIVLESFTRVWIPNKYPGIFEDVHFAGMWDTEDSVLTKLAATKAALCDKLDVDILVDDQLKHCVAVQESGRQAVLFGDYPWNRIDVLPAGVIRVHNWKELGEYFDGAC